MNGLRVLTALLQKGLSHSLVVEANLLSKVMKNDNANLPQTQFLAPFQVGSIQTHNSSLSTILTKLTSCMINTIDLKYVSSLTHHIELAINIMKLRSDIYEY